MSVNKVILVGRLGQNPELKNAASGVQVVNFTIATQESWLDKSGAKQEKTEWHRIVVFGKVAQNCHQYLAKGSQVYIEGKLQTRQWQDKDNQTRYTTEVLANTVQFLSTNPNRTAAPGAPSKSNDGSGFDPYSAGLNQGAPFPEAASSLFTEDDIPF